MHKLILIKHAPPEVNPSISSEQWHLGEKGRALCVPLAERVKALGPTQIFSSTEPKAVETAQELSRHLGVPSRSKPGLDEHDRRDVPHMRSGEFISMVELLFRRPGELVLGNETADEAYERFAAAVREILAGDPDATPALVTHGTVLALFLARHNPDRQGFLLWRQLGLPSVVVVDADDFRIIETIDRVA
ncbi:MAG: histidine phosphatase family protein [Gemmatimonadaceae bacterium]|nr:histidine phosphatase family protein [Gemmatimonadaceae bacterium]